MHVFYTIRTFCHGATDTFVEFLLMGTEVSKHNSFCVFKLKTNLIKIIVLKAVWVMFTKYSQVLKWNSIERERNNYFGVSINII
jgi:hypothetical protein